MAKKALERLSGAAEVSESAEEFNEVADTSVLHPSSPLAGRSEEEMQSFKAAQASELPPLSGVQSRSRLPVHGRDGAVGAAATSAHASVNFNDVEPPQRPPSAPPAPSAVRPAAPPACWTGRCPAGDVYVSTLPAPKMPRLGATGKKSKKSAQEPGAAQTKPGSSGGRSRSVIEPMVPQAPRSANAFEDWATSFDDPHSNDIKRIIMRSDEASKRIQTDLRDKCLKFKTRWMGELNDTELYEDRITFCGYGIRASKIGEKKAAQRQKQFGWGGPSDEAIAKNATRHDLFKHYKVDPGKGEPGFKALGKLLQESEPGRDRHHKKHHTKQEQVQQDMKSLFGGGIFKHDDEAKAGGSPVHADVEGGLAGSFKRSKSLVL